MSSRKNGREAVRQIKNSARKDNREKSHKLKRLVELNVLVLWLLLFFFFRWYITACLCADENMGLMQERCE